VFSCTNPVAMPENAADKCARQVAQTTRAQFDHFLHTPHVLTFEILDKRHLFFHSDEQVWLRHPLPRAETFEMFSLFFEFKHRSCTVGQILENIFTHLHGSNSYFLIPLTKSYSDNSRTNCLFFLHPLDSCGSVWQLKLTSPPSGRV